MRILWLSNSPWAHSGYGNQTALFAPRLKSAGHEVAIHAFYGCEGGVLNWEGIPVYPKHLEPYGQDIAAAHAQHFGADCIVTLIDAWVMHPELYQGIPWFPWAPVDMDPAPPPVIEKLRCATQPIAYARYGEQKMREAGLDPLYVPHGIDTEVFAPLEMADARRTLNWPADRFVVSIVGANKGWPDRKCLQQQIAAFARFKQSHPDALLYLHTTTAESGEYGGINVIRLLSDAGLRAGEDYSFPSQYLLFIGGFATEYLTNVYSASDVLLSVSMGEGFGIPIVEAQSCGCPVIVGDWTAMSELCFSGWKVLKSDAEPFAMPLHARQFVPHIDAVVTMLDLAYEARGDASVRERARAGALAYDVNRVMVEYWVPALQAMEAKLGERKRPLKVAGPLAA